MIPRSVLPSLVALALATAGFGAEEDAAQATNARPTDHVSRALSDVASFKGTHSPSNLSMAVRELNSAAVTTEHDRNRTLGSWIALFGAIDTSMPASNVPHSASFSVRPPKTPKGTEYPPDVTPSAISDPATRAAYERARTQNDSALRDLLLQRTLQTIDRDAQIVFKNFVATAFRETKAANAERQAIERSTLSAVRKKALLQVVPSG